MFHAKRKLDLAAATVACLAAAAGSALAAEEPKAAPAPRAPKYLNREIFSLRNAKSRAALVGIPGGTTKEAEAAVEAGLAWLAKAQEPDGSWSARRWGGAEGVDTGITGLALMAFLGAGYTHAEGPFKATVGKGLEWLKAKQDAKGSFGGRTFYEQGMATIAACEAFGLTQDREVRPLAERAVLFICKEQPDHGGFRYQGGTTKEGSDLSVSGWQITAIVTGICAGIESVPPQAVERCRNLLRNAFRLDGSSAYVVGTGEGPGSPSMTAIGMLGRELLGGYYSEVEIRAGGFYLLEAGGRLADLAGQVEPKAPQSLYFAYYSCLAMYQLGGKAWERWNALYREPLVGTQVADEADPGGPFIRGSWNLNACAHGAAGGRPYTTAMAVLVLETPYRYKRLPARTADQPNDF